MAYGAKLVIPGTLVGIILLSAFLLAVTAGISYPQPVRAAEVHTPTPDTPEQLVDAPVAEVIDAEQLASSCVVSGAYPQKILQWCDLITQYSDKHGLPPDLIAGLILQESGGNPVAYSKSGAVGLMQVMPRDGLASSFMCVNGPCFSNRPSIAELEDPEFNVAYGTKMLAGLIARHGNYRDALMAYGPKDVGYYYADIVLGHFERYRQ